MPWSDPRTMRLLEPGKAGVRLVCNKMLRNLLPVGHYILFAVEGWDSGGVLVNITISI